MYNRTILTGRVGKDPEIRMTKNGKKVATFTLATSKKWKNDKGEYQENVNWHNCVAFTGAEIVEKYVSKGSLLQVEGEINYRKWTDSNGVDKYVTDIQVNNFVLLDKKGTTEKTSTAEKTEEDDLDNSIPF